MGRLHAAFGALEHAEPGVAVADHQASRVEPGETEQAESGVAVPGPTAELVEPGETAEQAYSGVAVSGPTAELVEPEDTDEYDTNLAPWDGRRVPVMLLGGYLGAGKTTLINAMLATADRPIAVLVNDVGSVNIDARLIRRHRGGTIELTGGCVCCSLKNGLLAAFDELRDRARPPELVIVELSGVADPLQMVGLVQTPGFALDGVVVLADLENYQTHVEQASVTGDAVRTQLAAADAIVLTKADLVSEDVRAAVLADLRRRFPDTATIEVGSIASAANLVGLAVRQPVDAMAARPTLFDQHVSELVPLSDPIDRGRLDRLIANLPGNVVRAKGIARLDSGQMVSIQCVGRRRSVTDLPMAEPQDPTDLVVISLP